MKKIKPEPLTAEAFAPYGDVIDVANAGEERSINYGNSTRFHDLARIDVATQGGWPVVSIFRTKPLPRPIQIKVMERHPIGSQAFYPLSGRPFLVVVAEAGEFKPDNIKVFLAGSHQGINYRKGTWHHFSLALDEVSDFMCVDRDGAGDNCDEIFLDEKAPVFIDY